MTGHDDDTTRHVPLDWSPEPLEEVLVKTAEFVGTVPGAQTFTFGYDAVDRELEDGEEPDPGEAVRWWVKATARQKLHRGRRPVPRSWIRYAVFNPTVAPTPGDPRSHAEAIMVASIALLEAMGADRILLDTLTNRQDTTP